MQRYMMIVYVPESWLAIYLAYVSGKIGSKRKRPLCNVIPEGGYAKELFSSFHFFVERCMVASAFRSICIMWVKKQKQFSVCCGKKCWLSKLAGESIVSLPVRLYWFFLERSSAYYFCCCNGYS